MRIYTRRGDTGRTSLFGGKRVFKNHLRVNAYGSIDELNSLLGVVISKLQNKKGEESLNQIQKDLFSIGSHLAGGNTSLARLSQRVEQMEKAIDSLDGELSKLSNFVLPEGTEPSTFLYFARSVARRAERELVALSTKEKVAKEVLTYMNRLSDLLFILARYLNFKAGITETTWKAP